MGGTLRVSSPYGPRTSPITGQHQSLHNGMDLAIPSGTALYSIAPGVVSSVDASCTDPRNGAFVSITHTDGARSSYVHMSEVFVRKGQKVSANTKIGLSGGAAGNPCSGASTGPHLHFIIRPDGKNAADPTTLVNWHPYTLVDRNKRPIPNARSKEWGTAITHTPVYVWIGLAASIFLTIGIGRRLSARRVDKWNRISEGQRPRRKRIR